MKRKDIITMIAGGILVAWIVTVGLWFAGRMAAEGDAAFRQIPGRVEHETRMWRSASQPTHKAE